jgi:hypothetical protein
MRILTAIFFLVFTTIISSCRKESILTDSSAKLEFSEDTILFDTVFTSLGSTTKQLKLYNRNNRAIRISSITLAGGALSTYRLNVDGIEGKSFSDVEIPAKDSLYIFIEVTINPNSNLTPFILQDSIVMVTNGNVQDVDLVAFGQNARFIIANQLIGAGSSFIHYALLDTGLNTTITWDNSLPYVVWGGYAVVDSTQKLVIEAGTRIYFANNSGMWIYRYGTLQVNGTLNQPVKFGGIRREPYYQDVAGQWDRIWINEGSTDNVIEYAEIKNGFIGIQAESLLDTTPPKKLKLTNTIIQNMSGFGILSRYYNVEAANCVVTRCGQYALALTQGGGYEFRNCTIANYWSDAQRTSPSVRLDDYVQDENGNNYHFPLYKADFLNCIIWGNNDEELELDFAFPTPVYDFKNVLLKTQLNVSNSHFSSLLLNVNPAFADYGEDNYQLSAGSPAINAGSSSFLNTDTQTDILGQPRNGTPDLGAYEVQ